jgi:hypothetical protein
MPYVKELIIMNISEVHSTFPSISKDLKIIVNVEQLVLKLIRDSHAKTKFLGIQK